MLVDVSQPTMGFDPVSLVGAAVGAITSLFGPSELDIMREQRARAEAQADASVRYAAIQRQVVAEAAERRAQQAAEQAGVQRTMLFVGGAAILGGIGLYLWYRKVDRED